MYAPRVARYPVFYRSSHVSAPISHLQERSYRIVWNLPYFNYDLSVTTHLSLAWSPCSLLVSVSLAFQSHSATMLRYLVPCLILVTLFLSTPRLPQNHVSIIFGLLNKFVVHLMMHLSALLPLLLSLPDSIMLTPYYMAFQLSTSVVSSTHKIPLHVLSQVLALRTSAHIHCKETPLAPGTLTLVSSSK